MKMNEQHGRLSETASHIHTDPWRFLRKFTPARIALGRAGGSLPTNELLAFRLAHARAIDAVHQPFEPVEFCRRLAKYGSIGCICVTSAAQDARMFLLRPDLGRKLSAESAAELQRRPCDLVIIFADGLSELALQRHAIPVLDALLPLVGDWMLAPLIVAHHARVALQDEIGERLGAKLALTLIGERPGLVAPDSLGAYLVYGPKIGNTDANRNCISNIRDGGLSPALAAQRIFYLLNEARTRRLSGVGLKDESEIGRRLGA
jgi:ethanolamine ammonia-lyase small subunit